MKPEFLLSHSQNLLQEFISQSNSPASLSKSYFKRNPGVGSKERYAVNELTYFSLRNYYLSEFISKNIFGNSAIDQVFITSMLLTELPDNSYVLENIKFRLSNEQLFDDFKNKFIVLLGSKFDQNIDDLLFQVNDIKQKLNKKNDINSFSILYSTDINISNNLSKMYDLNEIKDYLNGMNIKPLPEIRVNDHKSNKTLIHKLFNDNVIDIDSLSPSCLKLNKHLKFNTYKEYTSGLFEVQSDGSQVVSLLAYDENDKFILDACAGAGGKSLHLADLSDNKANITSIDTDKKKIHELIIRKKRAGADSIFAISVKPFNATPLKNKKYDLVLIDAPCSGTGTSKRDPSRKIFLNNDKIKSYANYQYKVMEYYSKYVNAGGKLVYATCSILPEENELVVEKFLKMNPQFRLFEPIENLTNYNLKPKLSSLKSGFYRVHPLHNSTDGFFIATLRKKA